MKTPFNLKILINLSWLIFAFPFLQTCGSRQAVSELQATSSSVQQQKSESNENSEIITFHPKSSESWWQSDGCSLYLLAFYQVYMMCQGLFDRSILYINLFFAAIPLLNFFMLLRALEAQWQRVRVMAIISLCLLAVGTINAYLLGAINSWQQIKYGYVLFVVNTLFIVFLSQKPQKSAP
jgi:hypothetical protein